MPETYNYVELLHWPPDNAPALVLTQWTGKVRRTLWIKSIRAPIVEMERRNARVLADFLGWEFRDYFTTGIVDE